MEDFCIIIPTMNRAELLLGQLFFYDSFEIPVHVYIGDSSNSLEKQKIVTGIKELKHVKATLIDYDSKIPQVQVLINLTKAVSEKYISVSGDDDYHVLPKTAECLAFMKKNPDYSSCNGEMAMVESKISNGCRKIVGISEYSPKGSIECDDSIERIRQFSKNYFVPLFAVCKTKDFIEAFTADRNIDVNIIAAETLPVFKLLALGKFKMLPGLSMIRGTHALRPSPKAGLLETFFNKKWFSSLQATIDSITSLIQRMSLIQKENVRENLEGIFAEYYTELLIDIRNNENKKPRFRDHLPQVIKELIKPVFFRIHNDKINGGSQFSYSKYFVFFSKLNAAFKKSSTNLT